MGGNRYRSKTIVGFKNPPPSQSLIKIMEEYCLASVSFHQIDQTHLKVWF
jgi:hypothetical protein